MIPPILSPIAWSAEGAPRVLDQTLLPAAEAWLDLDSTPAAVEAIRMLRVRGAPLIGIAAAMAVAGEGARAAADGCPVPTMLQRVRDAGEAIAAARPTAVNLHWAVARMLRVADAAAPGAGDAAAFARRLHAEAQAIWDEDRAMCAAIGEAGATFIPDGATVLTHCNAGALATGGIGTALGPIYVAHARGRAVHVLADETRPLLQGARLTAWELHRAHVPVTILADNMAASRLAQGGVAAIFVGADRIAANGDAANKIGTYALALAARAHGVPFYVCAPTSTVDLACPDGGAIPIEQRSADEVLAPRGQRWAPEGVGAWNPAFDVTPAALITAIITERGVHQPAALAADLAP